MACDGTARDLLRKAENSSELNLDSDEDDENKSDVVEAILKILAMDGPTEKIRRQVDLLTNIQSCTRRTGETTTHYAARFNGAVAQYANDTGTIKQE